MTTAVRPAPLEAAAAGILSVECELTGNCRLECSHCCTLSGPKVSHGAMTLADWQRVVDSNLTHVRPAMWAAFEQYGVRLATSYYSDRP
ncbi:hypothetical protein AB0903_24335 [Streptomyces sp. NPDC048389]|uniref:hypothetical protein n=1 Tax=Streptomyces sp. NPDC048389 TaxID=3154622 RepID=UPI0034564770